MLGLSGSESRRDQEEGGKLNSQEEASPEEIKSREVELGWRVGLLLLQLFPNGGATDIVFVTVLHSSRDSNCMVLWSPRSAGWTLPEHFVVLAAVHGSLGLPGWRLFRGFTLLSPSPFPAHPRP